MKLAHNAIEKHGYNCHDGCPSASPMWINQSRSRPDLTKIRSEGENQSQVQFLYERLPAPKSEGRALITTGDGESQFAAISQTQT